jgi:hypothetical protein
MKGKLCTKVGWLVDNLLISLLIELSHFFLLAILRNDGFIKELALIGLLKYYGK